MCLVGADGPGGARDPHPEQSHVQQPSKELQTGGGKAREGLCEYSTPRTHSYATCST